jgi:hypothetical protein
MKDEMLNGHTSINGTWPQPLAFGYMRVTSDTPDEDRVASDEKAIKGYAAENRWMLDELFVDSQHGSYNEFSRMLMEAWGKGARHVIVPGAGHLSANSVLRGLLVEQARDYGTFVWILARPISD